MSRGATTVALRPPAVDNRRRSLCVLVLLSLGFMLHTVAVQADVHHVTVAGAGSKDGSSWANAHAGVQAALAAAESGDEIWVAKGTYKPTTGTDREALFQLLNDVALYGGFEGTETSRDQRSWEDHETILSGDIGTPGDNADNSYHVVTGSGTSATAVLDGFAVMSGNASDDYGGGMYNYEGSPTVKHCAFSGNWALDGGGMYNGGSSSPLVTDCTFVGNSTFEGGYGGGMYNDDSSPTVTNCIFSGNSAGNGGGMYDDGGSPTVIGCTFSGNAAEYKGSGMFNFDSSPTVTGCTFSGNVAADFGGGMCNYYSDPKATDCTFSNNVALWGGGMYNDHSNLTLMDCDFSRNLAEEAAGMYNGLSNPTVANCNFSENVASSSAGGMFNWESSPTVTNCIFSGNSADGGGGMYNVYSSPTVMSCTFSGNSAEWGGGMFNSSASPTVLNCTFSGNSAWDEGGGMCNYEESSPTVTNCTFSGNVASLAAAIYNNPYPALSSTTLANTILAGDCRGSLTSAGYNLESGTSCGCTEPTDQQNADPLLGPLADNGGPTLTHALLPCSPALDAIPWSGAPGTDQRGFPRPYPAGGLADIGAVEMQFAYPPGDVNGDLAIDLLDVVLCAQIARGLIGATACRRSMADVDGDGDVDEDDVTILSEYVLGIRTTLP
jgi:hypothetical protein